VAKGEVKAAEMEMEVEKVVMMKKMISFVL
jgi:hypothetical protein